MIAGWLCALCLLHPFHTTQAEMEWNGQTQCFEVSLKLQLIDAQRAIDATLDKTAGQTPKPVDQMSDDELGKWMTKYLTSRFRLEAGPKKVGELKWVGCQWEGASVWCYFELKPPGGEREFRLVNSLLTEFESDQVNTVVFRLQPAPVSVSFRGQQRSVRLTGDAEHGYRPVASKVP